MATAGGEQVAAAAAVAPDPAGSGEPAIGTTRPLSEPSSARQI